MIPGTPEEQKKEAFRLFEDGRYQESLDHCYALLGTIKEPALEVLAATNLFYTGKLEDAEVYFRDLVQKMPESSYVHSYLAKVLESRGDEGAIAEYAVAVYLDPTNQDALRSYSDYLIARRDCRGALPVLKRLVHLGKKTGDILKLVQALITAGEAEEALGVCQGQGMEFTRSREYLAALCATKNYHAAADTAREIYAETRDPAILRTRLDTLARYEPAGALDAYAAAITEQENGDIRFDYVLHLKDQGDYSRALNEANILCTHSDRPEYRLARCKVLAGRGDVDAALAAFEALIAEELRTKNDLVMLEQIIREYRQYILTSLPKESAPGRFREIVSGDLNVVSLLETARLYESLGNSTEARAWFYRAYRADYLNGGLFYAQFLAQNGEERECEKVMLYILSNVKKSADIGRVAAVIIDKDGTMYRMKRLMDQLIKKFVGSRTTLGSLEMEQLARSYFIVAKSALEDTDYAACKYDCLCGMDVLPAYSRECRLDDFTRLVGACKERSIADRPVIHTAPQKKRAAAVRPVQVMTEQMELSEQEQKIVEFLRSHRKATEMDLRKLLGTRRVVGIVNRLIQKAAAQEIMLIDKKGMGEDGEVYGYTGT